MKLVAPVSVVIPCYRCAATIGRAVESVLRQTLPPAEILLIEDGSDDGGATLAALQQLERLHPQAGIRIIQLPQNSGPSVARNTGWEAASQPYVAFLDADDAWHPRKIERQSALMSAHPKIALCGHGHQLLRDAHALPDWPLPADSGFHRISKTALLFSNRFITPSVMLRRDLPFRFAAGQRHMEDHLLWLEIVCSGQTVALLPEPLAAIYKPSYGVAGLSASYREMGMNDVANYWRLHRKGCLSWPSSMFWSCLAWLKFARRLLLQWGRRPWR